MVSIVPVLQLPYGFQIVEKFALKYVSDKVAALPAVSGATILWINRLNYRFWRQKMIFGGEYRLLTNTLADDRLDGFLVEAGFLPVRYVSIGVGYNFSSFSDNIYSRNNLTTGGFFFRVTGQY